MVKKLERDFFQRNTCLVAQELLGKVLVFQGQRLIINETEAYAGFDDPASHGFRGKTPRSSIMYGEAGFCYVYLIYGMYHCLNVSTEQVDYPAAVLIRGGRLITDLTSSVNLNGPGKVCRELGINLSQRGIDMTQSPELYFEDIGLKWSYAATPRIGIKQGLEHLWRFVALTNVE